MTDITDQELRDAREWAWFLTRPALGAPKAGSDIAAAHVILATVDAQETALADKLREIARNLEMWTSDRLHCYMNDAVRHAERIEQERDEARAEVESLRDRGVALVHERDEARAEVDRLTAKLDAMSKMVDSLNDDLSELRGPQPMPVHSSDQQENPADVKPGEAWIVEFSGERCTAVKDNNYFEPWSAVTPDGTSVSLADDEVTLVHRLVPAPRVITDPDELEQLAATSIIRDGRGWPGGVTDQGVTMISGFCLSDEEVLSYGPVTVLWEPGE